MNDSFNHSIPTYSGKLPWISTEQMIEVDRLMIEEYGIELIQMMENAGRCLAILAEKRFLTSAENNKNVIVLVGTGGNGGGAMVCARRLSAWGCNVSLVVTDQGRLTTIPKKQFEILQKMEVPVLGLLNLNELPRPDLIIDGIIGYSLNGSPKGVAKKMIEWANASSSKILALDTPSGIDLTSGTIHETVVNADATLTLALPKKGLDYEKVKKLRGELYLGDISIPPSLYLQSSLGLEVLTPFAEGDIVKID